MRKKKQRKEKKEKKAKEENFVQKVMYVFSVEHYVIRLEFHDKIKNVFSSTKTELKALFDVNVMSVDFILATAIDDGDDDGNGRRR